MDLDEPPAFWDGACEGPDAVDLVVEVSVMMSVFAADRAMRVDALHRQALTEAEAHGRSLVPVVERGIRLELAAALRITEAAADQLLAFSEALVHRYPQALESLGRAGMTERHAQALVDALDGASLHVREALIGQVVELAEREPVGTFRRRLRTLIAEHEAETLAERHAEALDRRRVAVEYVEDAMAWLHLHIPAVEAQAVLDRATSIAKVLAAEQGEVRTLDQLRADVLCDLLIEGDTTSHPERARGIRASVAVTVPALSLLGEGAGAGAAGHALVEGIGPIPLDRARELCGGADGWMRVLTHPETGMVLSVGRDQYRPPPALRRLVRWRADRCMAPGCGMPASRCEIDHSIAWEHGGTTSLWNTAPLCRGHHIVKHHGGWTLRQFENGTIEWTSPTGRRYLVEPERRVPVFRDAA